VLAVDDSSSMADNHSKEVYHTVLLMYILHVLAELLCSVDFLSSKHYHVPRWLIFNSVVSYFIVPVTVFWHIHNAHLQKMGLFSFRCLSTFNNLKTAE